MNYDAGLVLEGGASRGVFTAGVLDFLMAEEIWLPYVAGVSAGACNAVDYVSRQPGRTKECMIVSDKAYQYISMKNIVIHKSLFDMDMIFDKFPNSYKPFDYDTYFASKTCCELAVTNCLTGRAEYLFEQQDKSRLMMICRASSSIPIAAPMVYIDGIPYLDGGLADSVPIVRALRKGYKKNLIILTRARGYRKEPIRKSAALYMAKYRKYPELIRTILRRAAVYNRTMDFIEKLEQKGRVFVIRPASTISRTERSINKLEEFYQSGYDMMKDRAEELIRYLA